MITFKYKIKVPIIIYTPNPKTPTAPREKRKHTQIIGGAHPQSHKQRCQILRINSYESIKKINYNNIKIHIIVQVLL